MRYPDPLLQLIATFKKLPGVGNKTAERFAFHVLQWESAKLKEMGATLSDVKEKLQFCPSCGALLDKPPCALCNPTSRTCDTLCVVATAKDIFLIEGTKTFKGLYHSLGGLFSPIEGKFPDEHRLAILKERILTHQVREVILALDATLEGDATALYLKKELASLPLRLSRLALGLPMGSSLDFIDEGTLSRALQGRGVFN